MSLDLTPTCKKCGAKLDLSSMKAHPDGGFVCTNCFENTNPQFARPTKDRLRAIEPNPVQQQSTEQKTDEEGVFFNLKEYVCDECNYSFKKTPEFQVKVCPYCGKVGSVRQKVDEPADKFVQDANQN